MSGVRVLYKRIPPPPEPEDDPYPLSPTSPSYEYPEFQNTAGNIPGDEGGLNTHFSDDNDERGQNTHFSDDNYERGLSTHISDDDDRNNPVYDTEYDYDPPLDCDDTFSKEDHERNTTKCVTAILDHYNSQDKNVIKYNLVKVITSTAILDIRGLYGHVNFTAKSSLENSKEEFFFAELYNDRDHDMYMPTCIVALGEKERIGGVQGIKGNDGYYGKEIRVDTRHCYACQEDLMHPEDGTLYETGHHVDGSYGYY